ncbi:MAG TPA: hypothetical protein QGF58_26085 [Myxococcota bacterium]|nr:hypothetical protein [Myxococcota bacterium]
MTPLALLLLTSPESRAQDTGDVFVSLPKDQVGEIFVDGQPSGATAPGTVQVSAGTHMIQVKGDCLSDTRSADVGANGVTRLDMELKPLGGFAQITATPAEAAVRLDGSLIETPAAIELSCGRHTLVTKADRYLTDEREFVVEMGGAYSVNVELGLEGFGSLSVIVTPIDAKVFLDGSEVATGPTTIPEVPKGKHLVGATADDLPPREADVVVEEGKTARVELDLTGASDAPTELVVTDPITDAPKPEREPRDVNLGKIAGGSALIGVGVAALGAGTAIRLQGLEFHDHYSALDGDGDGFIDPENEAEAKRLWEQEIRPRKVQSAALFGVGGLAIAGGAGVFIILEDDGAMLGVTGRF